MASQEAHDWWADVQQDRDALEPRGRRSVAVWGDDFDFDLDRDRVAARRRPPAGVTEADPADELAPRRAVRAVDPDAPGPVRGHRFVRAVQARSAGPAHAPDAITEELRTTPRRIVLETAAPIDHVEPPRGAAGVIQIKGRPQERRSAYDLAGRPSRTPAERVAHRPDRIMLWVALLGFLLILLAFATGSSEAATL